jgi:hypothetical protein
VDEPPDLERLKKDEFLEQLAPKTAQWLKRNNIG